MIFTVKHLWTPLTSSLLQNMTVKNFLHISRGKISCSRAKCCYIPFLPCFLKYINCIQKTMLFFSPKSASQALRICKSVRAVYMRTSMTGLLIFFLQVCVTNDASYHQSSLLSENCCLIKCLPSAREEWDTQLQGYGRRVEDHFVFGREEQIFFFCNGVKWSNLQLFVTTVSYESILGFFNINQTITVYVDLFLSSQYKMLGWFTEWAVATYKQYKWVF